MQQRVREQRGAEPATGNAAMIVRSVNRTNRSTRRDERTAQGPQRKEKEKEKRERKKKGRSVEVRDCSVTHSASASLCGSTDHAVCLPPLLRLHAGVAQ